MAKFFGTMFWFPPPNGPLKILNFLALKSGLKTKSMEISKPKSLTSFVVDYWEIITTSTGS